MTEEYNQGLLIGKIPDEWLHNYLVLLPKTRKGNIIMLQNIYEKVFEKIIAR